ncbi:uncharacterized protein LOC34623140 [Cyclospora cayetanensis]|uniref:Uncharacterized protein LOC34623140 n=1 Tax=Cyclospora cayetanensis TaxID=88456 RepID=A0A6P6S5B5_9EIME|nr:uncharacterized protein LOC34623140 [Cyclospora cayetanensis]
MNLPGTIGGVPSRVTGRWRCLPTLRKLFVCSSLLILLVLQIVGAVHMRGSPGLELLIAALTPGLTLLCLLQWLAGRHRLKWCVALEQMALGAVFSVLLAVGLELVSALAFGRELRSCTPPPSKRAPFAAAGTAGFDSAALLPARQVQEVLHRQPLEENAALQAPRLPEEAHVNSLYSALLRSVFEMESMECGISSHGVSRHLISYIFGVIPSARNISTAKSVLKGDAQSEGTLFLCVAFVFLYMVLCIGFAEEFSKAATVLMLRPSRMPATEDWGSAWTPQGAVPPESSGFMSALHARAEKERSSGYNYVHHPLSMVVGGCCAALGFATIENLSYVFATKSDLDMAMATAWVRAFTAIPSHAANTGIAACFLAAAAANAAATARAPWRTASAPAEHGEVEYLEGHGVQTVGEAHAVHVSTGSGSSNEGRSTPIEDLWTVDKINPFTFRLLLQSALLPGILHGSYDAALTLASAAYSSAGVENSALIASGWLMLALASWWASIIMFCGRWWSTKKLETFHVYFARSSGYWGSLGRHLQHTPSSVVVPAFQPHFLESQQQQLLQQQLLQQQFAPIPTDMAAWQLQLQLQRWQQQQQQQLCAPMYRQYAPIQAPSLQYQQQGDSSN